MSTEVVLFIGWLLLGIIAHIEEYIITDKGSKCTFGEAILTIIAAPVSFIVFTILFIIYLFSEKIFTWTLWVKK